MKYQFTFYNMENKYKPITVTLTPRPNEKVREMKTRAVQKACAERRWTYHDLMYKYKYTKFRYRPIKEEIKDFNNPNYKLVVKEDE